MRVSYFLWLDEAADNQPGAGRSGLLQQRGDRLRGAPLHNLDAPREIAKTLDGFGKALGSPWRADEKAAATAAWLALT